MASKKEPAPDPEEAPQEEPKEESKEEPVNEGGHFPGDPNTYPDPDNPVRSP
jgi:hypothetical protein